MVRARRGIALGVAAALSAAAAWLWEGSRGGDHAAPAPGRPRAGGVPLTEVVDPPERFPSPMIVVRAPRRTWAPRGEGSVLRGEWTSRAGRVIAVRRATRRPRWPAAVVVGEHDDVGVLVPGRAIPRTVTVRVFDRALDRDGVPRGRALRTIECDVSAFHARRRPCVLQRRADGFVLALPSPPARGVRRVALNVTWTTTRTSRHGVGVVWGAWLYVMAGSLARVGAS